MAKLVRESQKALSIEVQIPSKELIWYKSSKINKTLALDGAAALDVGDQRAGEPKLLRPINSAFAGIQSRDIKACIRSTSSAV